MKRWGNSNLRSFLEALGGWLNDCDGYYTNTDSKLDPNIPNWQIIADALKAAKTYE